MKARLNESALARASLPRFEGLGYKSVHGQEIVPGEPGAERDDFGEVICADLLRGTDTSVEERI